MDVRRLHWSVVLAAALLFAGCSEEPQNAGGDGGDDAGETAVWVLGGERPKPGSTSFTALVTRLECASGVTGEVLPPAVSLDATEVVVTFRVATNARENANCQGNNRVPYKVELGEPIRDRALVDGACADDEAASTSFCRREGIRLVP